MVIHPCSDYAQLCLALVFTSEYSCSAPVTLLLYLQSRVSVRMVAGNGCKWIVQIQNVWVSWAFCSDFHNFLSILLDFHSFLSIFLRLAQNFVSILLRLLQGWRPMIIGVPPPLHLNRCSLLLLLTASRAHPHPLLCQWECLLLEEGSRCNSRVN